MRSFFTSAASESQLDAPKPTKEESEICQPCDEVSLFELVPRQMYLPPGVATFTTTKWLSRSSRSIPGVVKLLTPVPMEVGGESDPRLEPGLPADSDQISTVYTGVSAPASTFRSRSTPVTV